MPVLFVMALATLVFVLVAVMMHAVMITPVVAAVIVTVGIAQGTARGATNGGTQQAAICTACLLAQHVAAGRAQAAAHCGFGTAAPVGTHRTASGTANACADRGTCAATDMSTDHATHYAAQGTTDCRFSIVAGKDAATEQAKGQQYNRGMSFHQVLPHRNDEAMLAAKCFLHKPEADELHGFTGFLLSLYKELQIHGTLLARTRSDTAWPTIGAARSC